LVFGGEERAGSNLDDRRAIEQTFELAAPEPTKEG
jgi:hypothetical protein